jgi:hypothetical protein
MTLYALRGVETLTRTRRDCWIGLRLNRDLHRPGSIDLELTGTALVAHSELKDGGTGFSVQDPDALERLAYALVLLANLARDEGVLPRKNAKRS